MADPATMTAISMGGSILGGIFGASGASASAAAQSQMGMYQAGIALQNAKIAKQNAVYESVQGEQSAMRYGMQARQRSGEILAGQSASGLDVGSGTNKQVQESQKIVSNMDMAQIRANAAKAAYDYRVQAKSYEQEAMMGMMGAKNAESAGRTNVLSSIIGSATSVADKWLKAKEVGTFSSGLFGS